MVQNQDTLLTWTSRKGCPRLEVPPSILGAILESFSTLRTRLRDHVVKNILKLKAGLEEAERKCISGSQSLYRGHPVRKAGVLGSKQE